MARWDDVRRIALALPEATERTRRDGLAFWEVKGKGFVWERPLRASDVRALNNLGREVVDGPILGVRVEHLGAKEALLADDPLRAPKRLAAAYAAENLGPPPG
jgi:hypothetical protein